VRAVGRVLVAIAGFCAAVFAVAAFLLATGAGTAPPDPDAAAAFWVNYALWGLVAASMVGSAAFAPMVGWILLSEILGVRALLAHLFVGGVLGLLGAMGYGLFADGPPDSERLTVMLGAGFVGGFVYWLVAGRTAGLVGAEPLAPALPDAPRPGPDGTRRDAAG
jgi:hypothetical protein